MNNFIKFCNGKNVKQLKSSELISCSFIKYMKIYHTNGNLNAYDYKIYDFEDLIIDFDEYDLIAINYLDNIFSVVVKYE